MDWTKIIICGLWGLMVSLLVVPLLLVPHEDRGGWRSRWHSRARQLHHTHQQPVSRLGGCALVICFLVVSFMALLLLSEPPDSAIPRTGIIVSSVAMFLLGLSDDFRPLGARRKLLGQILIAAMAWWLGIRITTLADPISGNLYELGWVGLPVTVAWLAAMSNLVNLIDGIDGLAAGITLMLMALLAWTAIGAELMFSVAVAAGMAGALLGFLGYNFPPARIYLGDGGAYFLGFLVGALSVVNSQKGTIIAALIAPLFAMALPIIDTSLAIVRRGIKGLPVFRPDRGHIHHLMLDEGYTRRAAVLILYGICLVFLILALGISWFGGASVPVFLGVLFLVLLIFAGSFSFSRYWFSVGKIFSNSLEVRRYMPRVMSLCQWLEQEAQAIHTPDDLWESYRFGAQKLGLAHFCVQLADRQRAWTAPNTDLSGAELVLLRITVEADGTRFLEFGVFKTQLHEQAFRLTTELLAESWMRSTRKWKKLTGREIEFEQGESGR